MNFYYENRAEMHNGNYPVSIYKNINLNYLAHWHNEIEIAWVVTGNIKVGINHKVIVMEPGDLCLSKSGDIHYYDSSDSNSTVMILVIRIDTVDGFSKWLNEGKGIQRYVKRDDVYENNLSEIYQHLQKIKSEYDKEEFGYMQIMKAYTTEICVNIMRCWPVDSDDTSKPLHGDAKQSIIQKVLLYIESNISQELSLESIAKLLDWMFLFK